MDRLTRYLTVFVATALVLWLVGCWGLAVSAALRGSGLFGDQLWGFAVMFGALGTPGLMAIPLYRSLGR